MSPSETRTVRKLGSETVRTHLIWVSCRASLGFSDVDLPLRQPPSSNRPLHGRGRIYEQNGASTVYKVFPVRPNGTFLQF